MDDHLFDALSRVVSTGGPRRRLLGGLAALPILAGVLDLPDDVTAKDRRRRRKLRHKRRHGQNGRKTCERKSLATICAGRCGTVTNGKSCGKPVDCSAACADGNMVCCDGLCQSRAALNTACPAAETAGFLTFGDGSMRCASQHVGACTCLGGVFRACAPGTVCKPHDGSIICDWPSTT